MSDDLFWNAAAEAAASYSGHRVQLGSAGDSDYVCSEEDDDATLDYIISTLSPAHNIEVVDVEPVPPTPNNSIPVVDRETIGARRKGRRKGCKNKTPEERRAILGYKDKIKDEKERERVRNIQQQYQKLRVMLGDPTPHKKLCKQQVLNAAILYIKDLLSIINEPSHVKVRPIWYWLVILDRFLQPKPCKPCILYGCPKLAVSEITSQYNNASCKDTVHFRKK